MNISKPPATNTKPLSRGTFNRWRSPGLALSACVAAVCLSSLPARAVGFLDDPSTWTGSTACPNPSGCVDSLGGENYDIGGPEATGEYILTSPIAAIDTYISFDYAFEPTPAFPVVALAEYSLNNGSSYTLLAESQSSSIGPLLLTTGNSFSFRLTNSGEQPLLGLSNFSATTTTPVPAPLPLLGGAAAFGWIRRRRSQLKARQLVR